MASLFFTLSEYLKYRFRARGAHGLHSPFVYTLYTRVICGHTTGERELREIRKQLSGSRERLTFTDPKTNITRTSTIQNLVQHVASSHRFSCFLIRLIDHLKCTTVLETGTSIGLNTLYLSRSSARKIITLEGSTELAAMARSHFEQYGAGQVTLIQADLREGFGQALDSGPELIFLDADHRSEALAFCLEAIKRAPAKPRCVVIHDIYWSADMKRAWQRAVQDPAWSLTIDLFRAGLLFPRHPMTKQHFTLKHQG